ncbi:hypothetical protein EVAR_19115_1 [Eumeta japonica]|uniref:Uncharacterized protein n=1 Tax=Eumeta variegata TaxID=151549 RepID=A0A4C1UQZ1_EUMVA|nr:hypothetical protein EVAR_19115_1 [Eumeta japonica]
MDLVPSALAKCGLEAANDLYDHCDNTQTPETNSLQALRDTVQIVKIKNDYSMSEKIKFGKAIKALAHHTVKRDARATRRLK